MILQVRLLVTSLTLTLITQAQLPEKGHQDTLYSNEITDTVTVTAFHLQAKWRDAPAAVAVINKNTIQQLGYASLVPVFNTVAGVRMEERSPGSYRLSVRGSLLRSPFGIRNLKIYWDGIPLTDAGGNSYFNLMDYSQLERAEVIKGPASSMYGANTGGALLLHSADRPSMQNEGPQWELGAGGGAYGMFRQQAGYRFSDTGFSIQVKQFHQQSDGYRQQSRLRKDGGQVNARFRLNNSQQLSVLAFYTDLYYQTPGGITRAQMEQNPRLARQKTATLPGAADQNAGIYNKTAFGGISLLSDMGAYLQNTTVLILNHTGFQNPFITNYEKRNEWNYGGRTLFRYKPQARQSTWNVIAGAEWLYNKAGVDNYGNRGGLADTVQFKDRLRASQAFLFTQADLRVSRWLFQAGVSHNLLRYTYRRMSESDPQQDKSFGGVWAPRASVRYLATRTVSVYGIAARGFSPPSLAEVRPSDGNYYGDLQPEHGWNYELGVKGDLWNNRVRFDISAYDFRLRDAIVRRTNDAGAEYFVNAGGTRQQGIECFVQATLLPFLSVFNSTTYQPYQFQQYQVAGADYSGNRITGVPRTIQVNGVNLQWKNGWSAGLTLNNTSRITLNDAATVVADSYHLIQGRMGYRWRWGNVQSEVFVLGDNLLNEAYSLGNDLNAMGERYFNPSPGRNFSAGMLLRL